MVYNVTPYMDYHPGGEEELMKAAGIDGTDLFDQVAVLKKKVKLRWSLFPNIVKAVSYSNSLLRLSSLCCI